MRDILKITLGITLLIFQGWMFGIPGLIILSNYFPPIKKFLQWIKTKTGQNSSGK
jgi:hypothetical protein